MAGTEDVAELQRRLEMAEDELTFLKAVFEEYKDSSGELEMELDAQLKDLERSNLALKRENEQIRAQLQMTVTRSRKSAEEASNLTGALEEHLEELTKREKKAQSRIHALEHENEKLTADLAAKASAAAPAPAEGGSVSSAELDAANAKISQLQSERAAADAEIGNLKDAVLDARQRVAKVSVSAQTRFATSELSQNVPDLPPEDLTDLQSLQEDLKAIALHLANCETALSSPLTKELIDSATSTLLDHKKIEKLQGDDEIAVNRASLGVLANILLLGESLPAFKKPVQHTKTALQAYRDQSDGALSEPDMTKHILVLTQDIMEGVFDPIENTHKREQELAAVKQSAVEESEKARKEGESKAKQELEALRQKEKELAEAKLSDMMAAQNSANVSLEQARQEMERLKAESESQLQSARTEARQLAEKARREALEEAAADRKRIEEEIYTSAAKEMDNLKDRLEQADAMYQQATMKSQMYQDSVKVAIKDQSKEMLQAMKNARDELETLKRGTQSELAETQKLLNENLNHVRKVARTIAKTDIAQLSMMYERELDMRVKLQDQVQALRGNIRVFCRIRPLLGGEIENGEVEAVTQTDEMTVTTLDPDDGKTYPFNFDRVFGPQDTQEIVFDEMRTLCLSALDGYNVCLFAYGITGSGKTFTVEGGEGARENPKMHGLVYRTLKEIFRIAFGERAGAYETNIEVELLELYNDDLNDLLIDPKTKNPPKVEVRIVPGQGVKVEGTKLHPVTNLQQALETVKQGYTNRTTKATDSNSLSSRSHSILTLYLNGTNLRTKKTYKGKLHFVDLAGSERVGKSGVQGDALKEAQAINKSLSALGDVVQALSQKQNHIPYRNSTLTKLLQESLGGNSKTVMMSNVSPCQHSLSETVASLRFATRAHKVEMGKATQVEGAQDKGSDVKNIKNKMADLESKFNSRRGGRPGQMKPPSSTPRNIGKERSPRKPGKK